MSKKSFSKRVLNRCGLGLLATLVLVVPSQVMEPELPVVIVGSPGASQLDPVPIALENARPKRRTGTATLRKVPQARYPFGLVAKRLKDQQEELSRCFLADPHIVGSVQMVIVFESTGRVSEIKLDPAVSKKVEDCLLDLVTVWDLPRNPSGRSFEFQTRVWLANSK